MSATPLPPATDPTPFHSFFMGGFEGATHRRQDGRRVDVTRSSRHDLYAEQDFALLQQCGIRTVRDSLRWHRIERSPALYDFGSLLPILHAAHRTGTQVLWDLCHWGVPDGVDPFSPVFPDRFALFARAAARVLRAEDEAAGLPGPRFYAPINEISFWSLVGGEKRFFFPFGHNRGPELKRQLVRASVAAIHAVRDEDPTARFVQPEPAIHIAPSNRHPGNVRAAAQHTAAQFESWDMLAGLQAPELGGSPSALDLVGINFYWNNQWIHNGERTPPGHPRHRPLHLMLEEIWLRYHRPLLLTETGAEFPAGIGWLGYIGAELREARRRGVPVLGCCLYPVADYTGWDDLRHVPVGLIEASFDWSARTLRPGLTAELAAQQTLFPSALPGRPRPVQALVPRPATPPSP